MKRSLSLKSSRDPGLERAHYINGLMALIADIKAARAAGASDEQLATARDHQRRAQFLLDFIEAENSMGFHADREAVRVLALSLDETRRGQASLPGQPVIGRAQDRHESAAANRLAG